ncbi:MAG: hypothetical protein QOF51_750 [Chloroflexota bacterium]|jgi:hypothetical protein|nr:hypothetical protein [Chloroflexota bacterium]
MVEAAPNTEKLDAFLQDVVRAVKAACNTAAPHLKDPDLSSVDKAIVDCEEILDEVMDGHVDEWVA